MYAVDWGFLPSNPKKRTKFEHGISPKTESEDVWILLWSLELGITISNQKSSRAYAVEVQVLITKVVILLLASSYTFFLLLRSPLEVNKGKICGKGVFLINLCIEQFLDGSAID